MASLNESQSASIISAFSEIEADVTQLLMAAAGLSDSVMTFLCACQQKIIVPNEPSSIADAYATIKVMLTDYKLDDIWLLLKFGSFTIRWGKVIQKHQHCSEKLFGWTSKLFAFN